MKKILWIGSYLNPSGFAKVNRSIIKHLADRYEITMLDYDKVFKESQVDFEGIKMIGCNGPDDIYGFKRLQQINFEDFDIVFILNDPWGLTMFLHIFKQRNPKVKIVCYFPIDSTGQDKEWYDYFDIVDVPVTYTKFAYKEVLKVAPQLKDRLQIIPHGIDTDIFYKIDKTKAELRQEFFKTDRFNNHVIFLNANRNQPRKRLDITLKAFSLFLKGKPDALLYMHCGNTDVSNITDLRGMNISKLAERYGIVDQLIMTNGNTKNLQKVSDAQMNMIFNVCDIGLNSSMGEGWGLCNTEHAATGAIQIVPNHSACAELFSNLPLTKIAAEYTLDDYMTIGKIPSAECMGSLMFLYYCTIRANTPKMAGVTDMMVKTFTADRYQWKNIAEQWHGIFSKL